MHNCTFTMSPNDCILYRMQTILEGLANKIEAVDVQLHNLQHPTAAPQPLNVVPSATTADSTAAKSLEETNKRYLLTLDSKQVRIFKI